MKQRIISAIIAIIIVMPMILYGNELLYLGVSMLGMIGFYEILKMRDSKRKIPDLMKIVSLILFIIIMMDGWGFKETYLDLKSKLILMLFFIIVPVVFYNDKDKYNVEDSFYLIGSILFLSLGFNTIASIRVSSLELFIYVLVLVVMTDTFAYFIGSFLGKKKLCPKISPNKTWEGFFGGLIFGTIISVIVLKIMTQIDTNLFVLILISLLISLTAQIGDMVFSSFKRYYGIKDFGKLMPGHGGVLDRLDSLIFASLAFSYLFRFF